MTIEVRATRPDEYRAAVDAMVVPLMAAPPNDDDWNRSRPSWDIMPSFSAWDGERCVAHAGHFLVETTVPGGARLATAAVTRVGVLPTHRRRGLATRLMRALIDDARERGLALMSLRASEAVIYGRYGFGVAGDCCEVAIDPRRAGPVAGATGAGSFRYLVPSEMLEVVPPLYERVAHRRPGTISRPRPFWERYLREAIDQKHASYVVTHLDANAEPDGFVHYESKWDEGGAFVESAGTGKVHDLFGADDAVELALWQFLFGLDLVARWTADQRPVDDLVRHAVSDRRAYRHTSITDEQWLRLLDVDAALAGRSYRPASGSVTIEVDDPLVLGNCGRWQVSASGAERTDGDADLKMGIETLSAAYLGGTSWTALAGTGSVEARNSGAIELADVLFASPLAPFCGSFF
jgi:predicted acetyltransferase